MKKKNLLQRVIIIAVVSLVSLYAVFGPRERPTARDFTWTGIKETLRENIRLGLDLRGGSHLVMQVRTEDYLNRLTADALTVVQNAVRDGNFGVKEVRPETGNGSYRVVLEANDGSNINAIRDAAAANLTNDWNAQTSGNRITWTMSPEAQRVRGDQAVEQALSNIESRINAVGVAEPTLQRHGGVQSNQILLQMPGIQDPERVKRLLIADAKLELAHVVGGMSPAPATTYPTKEAAVASLGGTVPANRRVLPYAERDEPTSAGGATPTPAPDRPTQWVVVESPAIVDGSELRNAEAVSRSGRTDDYQISFALKPSGAQKFGNWTGANVNQYMAVVLNDEVKSIAYIKSQITDQGQIDGRFTETSAKDLALTLRSGALPARLVYQEERTVGPSLGADSIRSGVYASLVGLGLVVFFMLAYYRGAGVNAVVALLLNMVMTMAALVIFNATLTLPGIAGLILSIGMAVDSNVLIFERMREEIRAGKSMATAVDLGFSRAFVAIIDTHVTTIISSLFLFVFGTGPIRGFAVTLVLGLIANLFSAVYVSRTIFIWLLSRKQGRVETLSI